MPVDDPYELLGSDPVMAALVDEHGEVAVEPHPDPFERLVTSIINQQLSTASATAIRERVFERVRVTPEGLLDAAEEDLLAAGLSARKVEYLRSIAAWHRDEAVSPARFEGLSDEAVIDELTAVRGIGVWTAKMYLIFCLGRTDVFPVEDLGIRRAMESLYDVDTRDAMVDTAERWEPFRSYASRHLWRATD